jgi:ribonuclease Z
MYQIRDKSLEIKLPKLDFINIQGYSRSTYRTGYLIQPFNIYLDAGLSSPIPPNLILLSHSHLDHNAELYSLLIKGKNTPVMLPNSELTVTQLLLNNFHTLNSGKIKKYSNWRPIVEKNFKCTINKKNFIINTFTLDHSVNCQAYSIDTENYKLKDEYKGLTGKELGILKKEVEITEKYNVPMLLFVSDTGKSILSTLPFSHYPLVIIECTFIEDNDYQESVKKRHLHINDLLPIVKICNNTTFIFGHFSCKYDKEYLIEKEKIVKSNYPNVAFWI